MEDILNFIKELPPALIFVSLFISAFLENIVPPVPGDTVTVFGGALVGFHAASFTNVFFATWLGSLLGFMALYVAGRTYGRQFFERPRTGIFHPENLNRIENWFNKYGAWLITANRFLAGTRSIISVFSGILKKPWLEVVVLSSISIVLWNGMLIFGGYYLGQNWHLAEQAVKTYSAVISIILALMVIAFIVYRVINRKKKNSSKM